MIGIYRIICLVNGLSYIGQSKDIEKRWEEHDKMLKDGKHHSYKLQEAYNMYGDNAFMKTVVEIFPFYSKDILDVREKLWIKYFDSYSNGFNCTKGNDINNNKVNTKRK